MHSFCYCDKDPPSFFFFFFFNDTATTEIYTLSLHDALPISCPRNVFVSKSTKHHPRRVASADSHDRSEEHTSELQSQSNLVCRLLLEKKKKNIIEPPEASLTYTTTRIYDENVMYTSCSARPA